MNGSIAATARPEEPPRRRRRRLLDETAIADAVIAVGFEDITIQAVAAALGITHSSLYNHVSGREELVSLGLERLARRLPAPVADGGAIALLEREAWVVWELLERHTGLALELVVQSAPPPAVIARGERIEGLLRGEGIDADAATLALDLVVDLAFDNALRAHHLRQHHDALATLPDPREWFERKLAIVLAGLRATFTGG